MKFISNLVFSLSLLCLLMLKPAHAETTLVFNLDQSPFGRTCNPAVALQALPCSVIGPSQDVFAILPPPVGFPLPILSQLETNPVSLTNGLYIHAVPFAPLFIGSTHHALNIPYTGSFPIQVSISAVFSVTSSASDSN